jgi:predicted nucleotidyltransferase
MTPLFGLAETTLEEVRGGFRHRKIAKAVIYGSRAKGNYKPGSDSDLTLFACDGEEISPRDLADILDEIDELLLPYTVDLSAFAALDHAKLREHIARVGQVFYERGGGGGEGQGVAAKAAKDQ